MEELVRTLLKERRELERNLKKVHQQIKFAIKDRTGLVLYDDLDYEKYLAIHKTIEEYYDKQVENKVIELLSKLALLKKQKDTLNNFYITNILSGDVEEDLLMDFIQKKEKELYDNYKKIKEELKGFLPMVDIDIAEILLDVVITLSIETDIHNEWGDDRSKELRENLHQQYKVEMDTLLNFYKEIQDRQQQIDEELIVLELEHFGEDI